jgi:hypothetical protein
MASADTLLTLEADEEAVIASLDEFGGFLLRETDDAAVYWLVLHPKSEPQQNYYARMAWSFYPDHAPSVRYHDGIRGPYDVGRAWPVAPGYRVGSWDICKPLTAEGYALHPEWATGPHGWKSSGNPFLWVAQALQNDLNHNYQGRNP